MGLLLYCRAEFEEEGLKSARERLSHLENVLQTERVNLDKHEAHKAQVLQEIESLESQAKQLKTDVGEHQEELDEKTKVVEQVKRTTTKAGRTLDQSLKDISSCVGGFLHVSRIVC